VASANGVVELGGLTEGVSYTAFGSSGVQQFVAINQEAWLQGLRDGTLKPAGVVGDGVTDDTAALQAAISAGPVYLPPGTYLTGPLALPAHAEIRGAGVGATTLKLKASSAAALLSLVDVNADRVTLSGFQIDGNRASQSSSNARGIYLLNTGMGGTGLPNHRLAQLIITECKGDGLRVTGPGESHFSNIYSYRNDGVGVYCEAEDTYWNQIVAGQSGLHGFRIAGSNTHWTNCKAWFSGRITAASGIGFLFEQDRIVADNIEAQDNQSHGIVMLNADNCRVSGMVDSNGTGITAGTGMGIRLDNALNNQIDIVAFDRLPAQPPLQGTTRTQAYALEFANNPANNRIRITCGQHLTGIWFGSETFNALAYTNYDGNSYEILKSSITVPGTFNHKGASAGFYNATPIAKPTGVAVTAAGVHAALVSLGLIAP
jgi:hypothetical protein